MTCTRDMWRCSLAGQFHQGVGLWGVEEGAQVGASGFLSSALLRRTTIPGAANQIVSVALGCAIAQKIATYDRRR